MTQQLKHAEALRESLLWTASSLAALGKEHDVIVLEGRRRTVGEILDEANEALEVATPPASAQDDAKDESERGPVDVLEIARETGLRSYLHGVNAMEARMLLQRFVDALPLAPAAGDALPDLNADLIEILGRPNFTCIRIAQLLRLGGVEIAKKAEAEQATVIHYLLGFYFQHGSQWGEKANEDIERRRIAALAASQQQEQRDTPMARRIGIGRNRQHRHMRRRFESMASDAHCPLNERGEAKTSLR